MKRLMVVLVLISLGLLASCSAKTEVKNVDVVKDWGVVSGEGYAKKNSKALKKGFASIASGSTVYFPEGNYEINNSVSLKGLENIKIYGENATLINCGADNTKHQNKNSGFFVIENAKNISFSGLNFKYSNPTSLSCEAQFVSSETGEILLKVTDGSVITGNECVTIANSFDKNGIPDKKLEQYAVEQFKVEKISDNELKISGLDKGALSRIGKGTKIALRLATDNSYIFSFYGSEDILLENIGVANSFNGAVFISYCNNLTLKNVSIAPESGKFMSTNADGVHISGLSGKLLVENCSFISPGDDCINVHSMAYRVVSVRGNKIGVDTPRFGFDMSWAKVGDVIEFFNPDFNSMGTAVVSKVDYKVFEFESLSEDIKPTFVIYNQAKHPEIEIKNCTVKNNRARGFLLQSKNVTVENCSFEGTSLAAILLSPDLDVWYEMSPTENVVIKNNSFVNCGSYGAKGVVQIGVSHDNPNKTYPERSIHKNIEISNNSFTDCYPPMVSAICTNGLKIADNSAQTAKVLLVKCDNVTLSADLQGQADLYDCENTTFE